MLPTFHVAEWVNQTLIVLVAVGGPLLFSLHGDPAFEALAEKIMPAREFAKGATLPR